MEFPREITVILDTCLVGRLSESTLLKLRKILVGGGEGGGTWVLEG